MKKNNTAGFSFIELLIAMAIFSIIAVSIYSILNTGANIWSRGGELIEKDQRMRVFFDIISKDLINSIPWTGAPSEWKEDKAIFYTVVDSYTSNGTQKVIVRKAYYFDDKHGEFKTAEVMLKQGGEENYINEHILMDNLKYAGFSYPYASEDEYKWKAEWKMENSIPKGVRLSIQLKDKNEETIEAVEKTVFIPMGTTGKDKES